MKIKCYNSDYENFKRTTEKSAEMAGSKDGSNQHLRGAREKSAQKRRVLFAVMLACRF